MIYTENEDMIKTSLDSQNSKCPDEREMPTRRTSDMQEAQATLSPNQSRDSLSFNDENCEELMLREMRISTEPINAFPSFELNCDPTYQNIVLINDPLAPTDSNIPQICVNGMSHLSITDKDDELLELSSTPPKRQTYTKLECKQRYSLYYYVNLLRILLTLIVFSVLCSLIVHFFSSISHEG